MKREVLNEDHSGGGPLEEDEKRVGTDCRVGTLQGEWLTSGGRTCIEGKTINRHTEEEFDPQGSPSHDTGVLPKVLSTNKYHRRVCY